MKDNTEHTEENETVKNEASFLNDVENDPSEEEPNNESTSEHDNEDKNDQSKDEEIQQSQLKANEDEERYLRLYAEFENYKRRIRNKNETNKKHQAQHALTDILPTIDSTEHTLQIEGDDESFKSFKEGVQTIHRSLLRVLKDDGLEEIESEGQGFDPNFHQAVAQDNNSDFNSGETTQGLQKGYKLKDRVLRPFMVKANQ